MQTLGRLEQRERVAVELGMASGELGNDRQRVTLCLQFMHATFVRPFYPRLDCHGNALDEHADDLVWTSCTRVCNELRDARFGVLQGLGV